MLQARLLCTSIHAPDDLSTITGSQSHSGPILKHDAVNIASTAFAAVRKWASGLASSFAITGENIQ
jgi:hypothetical protein